MGKTRVPFEFPVELKSYFDELIRRINPGIGFNPFLRAILFCLADVNPAVTKFMLGRGAQLEKAFSEGAYSLAFDEEREPSETDGLLLNEVAGTLQINTETGQIRFSEQALREMQAYMDRMKRDVEIEMTKKMIKQWRKIMKEGPPETDGRKRR